MANTRPICTIAHEIYLDWAKITPNASMYLSAMFSLHSVDDTYGWDSAKSIILYFLSNASTWKGETAKRIKSELKSMCK